MGAEPTNVPQSPKDPYHAVRATSHDPKDHRFYNVKRWSANAHFTRAGTNGECGLYATSSFAISKAVGGIEGGYQVGPPNRNTLMLDGFLRDWEEFWRRELGSFGPIILSPLVRPRSIIPQLFLLVQAGREVKS